MKSRELLYDGCDRLGRLIITSLEHVGGGVMLFYDSVRWIFIGGRHAQPLRLAAIVDYMWEIGITALPLAILIGAATGVMLSVQMLPSLRSYGAEAELPSALALAVSREFGPLIIAVFVAGRSGSELAARTASMQIAQEIDALRAIGIKPVRYLVSPALIAMLLTLPVLTFSAEVAAAFGAGGYFFLETGNGLSWFLASTVSALTLHDLLHGMGKSLIFSLLIVIVAFRFGFSMSEGSRGVGRAATGAVVVSMTLILLADMIFSVLAELYR